jgi:hypothetical protein
MTIGTLINHSSSLAMFVAYFDSPFSSVTLSAVMLATLSFVAGAFCLIFVYRSDIPV